MILGMILISVFLVNNAAKEFDGMSGDSAGYGYYGGDISIWV